MKIETALERLHNFDRQGIHVYLKSDLRRLFFDDSLTAFQQSLLRLVKAGVLERVCNGVYVFSYSRHRGGYTIEYIAKCLRRGEYNYISLESALSEYSVISQVMIEVLSSSRRKGMLADLSLYLLTLRFFWAKNWRLHCKKAILHDTHHSLLRRMPLT